MVKFALLAPLLFSISCVSSTVVFDSKWDKRSSPVYVDYFDAYFLGFVGHASVNLANVCMDQKVHGFRRAKKFEDIFLTAITVGIYSPSTVSVWCGD